MNLLLLQMSIVLLVTVGCGWIARQLGQARVIGEIAGFFKDARYLVAVAMPFK